MPVNPLLRQPVLAMLDHARKSGAIIYYDVNFRSSHQNEVIKLRSNLLENFEYADIVRGSNEDFHVLFGKDDADTVYRQEISFYTHHFIYTQGAHDVEVRSTGAFARSYPVAPIPTVSTVGAGDNFNAGFIFGLIRYGIRRSDLERGLSADQWEKLIATAQKFSAECCKDVYNYVGKEFGEKMKKELPTV